MLEPNSTPSGTMTAARPPGLSSRRNRARKSSSVFLVLTICLEVLRRGLVVEAASERRIGQDQGVALGVPGRALGKRIAVTDVRLLDLVEQHVHAGDAQHGAVEVEAVEHAVVEVTALRKVQQRILMRTADEPGRLHQEPGCSARRVADLVRGPGAVISTMSWMMCRGRTELAVLPGRGDLAEHVLVQVTLGIPLAERDVVNQVNDLGQEVRRWDRKPGVLHMLGVRRVLHRQGRAARERHHRGRWSACSLDAR